jgi:ABC-type multidrug transport system fused ATPase/permease subunit
MSFKIDETRIQENLKTLSFPRIYGSDAERRCYKIVKEKIEKLNLTAITQKFSFSNFYSIFYIRIMATLIFCLLFVLYLNFLLFFHYIVILILLILFIFTYIISFISRKPDSLKIGKHFHSQNIYVKINSDINEKHLNNKKEIIFLAHLDSKSQSFNVVNRVKMFVLWFWSIIFSVIFITIKNIYILSSKTLYTPLLYIFGAIPLGLNLFTVILILLNKTNNDSNGALDNASGIACVLELLSYYSNLNQELRLKNLNLWFVFTGAEECGTQGIRKFYKILKEIKKDKKQFIVINFDAIGTKLDLIKFGLTKHKTFKFQEIFLKNTEKVDLNVKKRKVPIGVHTDGYFFFKRKYQGLEFGDWDSHKYLHTIDDTIDKIDFSLLKKLCEIVTTSLKELDGHYLRS